MAAGAFTVHKLGIELLEGWLEQCQGPVALSAPIIYLQVNASEHIPFDAHCNIT